MEDYKNLKEDNDLFPYEYGSLIYNDAMMNKRILDLFRRKELESNMDLICKHMEENGVVFSSPGGSFQRKLLAFLSRYMNYRLRHPHRSEIKLWYPPPNNHLDSSFSILLSYFFCTNYFCKWI